MGGERARTDQKGTSSGRQAPHLVNDTSTKASLPWGLTCPWAVGLVNFVLLGLTSLTSWLWGANLRRPAGLFPPSCVWRLESEAIVHVLQSHRPHLRVEAEGTKDCHNYIVHLPRRGEAEEVHRQQEQAETIRKLPCFVRA